MALQAFDPNVEIIGRTIVIYTNYIDPQLVSSILQRYHVDALDPEQWYPLQLLLDILAAVQHSDGALADFVTVGLQVAAAIPFPEYFDTLPLVEVLQSVPQGYYADHRGGDFGFIETELIGDSTMRFILRTPYPDDFFYGVCYGLVKRYALADTRYTVVYDETVTRRDFGGETTVINVSW